MVDKDWIQNRADEIANKHREQDFYDLPENIQLRIYNQALADYADYCASKVDAIFDRLREYGH